jgi:YD repeat-containing protein
MTLRLRALCAGLMLSGIATTAALADDVNYSYDALGRLTRVEYANGSTIVYNYDAAGNRTSVVYNGANGTPTANPDNVSTTLGRAITFDPRANDSDPDNDPLTITQINTPTAAQHAQSVTINSGQTLTYTPATGFPATNRGTDTFSYTITDGQQHTATTLVNMTVTDRPPVAVADTVGVAFQTATNFKPMANDSDPDGDTMTITVPGTTPTTLPSMATIQRSGTSIIYTPATGFSGTDTFNYTISDGHGNTATAMETMNVGVQNRAPTANNDSGAYSQTAAPGHPVTPYVSLNPLLNDTDPDGDTLTVISVTQPASGNATVGFTSNSVTYQYNSAVSFLDTTDSFSYTISDGHGHTSAPATVTVYLYVETGT